MTAIITKQNAKDKAFIGGGGDGSEEGDNPSSGKKLSSLIA